MKQALAPLGEDYQALLQEGFDNRWIDIYENEGKRTGAYSWGAYGTHPYVLLNYHGSLNDVFTLAHEMGHALHSWHSDHSQTYLYAGYKIFVAEVASTCNEALLISDLLKRSSDPVERKYLINYFLDQFKGTMYRQTMFAEFEMLTHDIVSKGGVLTADQLCELYLTLNKKYFGEEMISDPEIAYRVGTNSTFLYTILCVPVCYRICGSDCYQQQDSEGRRGNCRKIQAVPEWGQLHGSDRFVKAL